MAADAVVNLKARCNSCGDAGQEQSQVVERIDEETGFPHRVQYT